MRLENIENIMQIHENRHTHTWRMQSCPLSQLALSASLAHWPRPAASTICLDHQPHPPASASSSRLACLSLIYAQKA